MEQYIKEQVRYCANGLTFKLEKEQDGWWSIYLYNPYTGKYKPRLQARDLEHAKSYCDMVEPVPVPLKEI